MVSTRQADQTVTSQSTRRASDADASGGSRLADALPSLIHRLQRRQSGVEAMSGTDSNIVDDPNRNGRPATPTAAQSDRDVRKR